jgi:hypothetical protein
MLSQQQAKRLAQPNHIYTHRWRGLEGRHWYLCSCGYSGMARGSEAAARADFDAHMELVRAAQERGEHATAESVFMVCVLCDEPDDPHHPVHATVLYDPVRVKNVSRWLHPKCVDRYVKRTHMESARPFSL